MKRCLPLCLCLISILAIAPASATEDRIDNVQLIDTHVNKQVLEVSGNFERDVVESIDSGTFLTSVCPQYVDGRPLLERYSIRVLSASANKINLEVRRQMNPPVLLPLICEAQIWRGWVIQAREAFILPIVSDCVIGECPDDVE